MPRTLKMRGTCGFDYKKRCAMYHKIISIIMLSTFVSYLVGCTSIKYLSNDKISEIDQKQSIWVILADSSQYEIKKPQIQGNQLSGYFGEEGYKEINISEVEKIGIRKVDVGKTLLIGTAGFAATILLISALSSDNSSNT